jgi:hypothetical protein
MTKQLYESVTNKIIADLENGCPSWIKPWKDGNSGGIMPINAATHRHYSGINILILWATREEHGYPTPEWMTFKQSVEKGGCVRKGEKGTHVVFAKPHTLNEGEDDERKMFMHKIFTVFNLAQIDGLPEDEQTHDFVYKPEDNVNKFIEATGADIRRGGDMAAFIPSQDYIKMPLYPLSKVWRVTMRPISMNSDTGVEQKSGSTAISPPALARKTTLPRNWLQSLHLRFYAPSLAYKENYVMPRIWLTGLHCLEAIQKQYLRLLLKLHKPLAICALFLKWLV